MSVYELGILGDSSADERHTLRETIGRMVSDFELVIDQDVILHEGADTLGRDKHAAFAAVFFGGPNLRDLEIARQLQQASVPIIPTVSHAAEIEDQIPAFLSTLNVLRRRPDDLEFTELAISLLECVGLLRRQRRVFVSYRRTESRSAAIQLHDLLTGRGFDVFLDTHDIRPGEPFQDVLWHRLCDSDVMVMLDTPTYFESKWTRQEMGRARAKEIHVLRIVWPDHTPSRVTELAETIYLDSSQLLAADGPISPEIADVIALAVEDLRSRSIASRYMSITGRLRAEVERIGGIVEGVGPHRAISLHLPDDRKIWAYPIVGIPTAELLNDVADKARRANQREIPVLVYDHIGISVPWMAHLEWLDENIRCVRTLRVLEAAWLLPAWGT
jgi:hypothetical protein